MLKQLSLNNGLKLLLYPMEKTEAVTFLFLTRIGSKHETKELNGISHLLEHLLFRGTKNWPKSSALSQELDRVGGFYNAFTDKEMLGIIIKVGSDNLRLAIDILADMAIRPLLKENCLASEKKVVIEEIRMREDDPKIKVLDVFEELLYKEQAAGWPVSGTEETVGRISIKNVATHFKKYFIAKNSLISIAGNFDEKSLCRKIEKGFSRLINGENHLKPLVKEGQKKPEIFLSFKGTDQTHLCLGARTFNVFSPKKYPLAVMANILGGMMSSRLFVEVREKQGLAYYLRTVNEHYTDSGYLMTHAGVSNEKTDKAIKIICREYQKLKEKKVGPKELKRAKDNLEGHLRLGLETSDQFAGFFGSQAVLEKEILTPEEELKKIAKITPDDILKVAREVFLPERLNLALIGPHKEKEKFLKLLNG